MLYIQKRCREEKRLEHIHRSIAESFIHSSPETLFNHSSSPKLNYSSSAYSCFLMPLTVSEVSEITSAAVGMLD